MTSPILEFIDIVFRYAGTPGLVLDGFSLAIPAGAITAILGPNGSGKTTLKERTCVPIRAANSGAGSGWCRRTSTCTTTTP